MRTITTFAVALIAMLPAPVLAASCLPALTAPQPREAGEFEFIMTTLDRTGISTYSRGPAVFRGRIPGPVPSWPRWMSSTDRTTTLYRDVGRRVAALDPPRLDVLASVSISVTSAVSPAITLRFLDTGVTHRLAGTCSTAGIIYGTSPVIDALIQLRRPAVVD